MTGTWTDNVSEYGETHSTYGVCPLPSIRRYEPIIDTRPWYRRWWFGFCRDGELWIGLGPVAFAVTRS